MSGLRKSKLWVAIVVLAGAGRAQADALLTSPNDPYYQPYQWYANTIHLPEAWTYSTGSPSVTVAVLDTGVRGDSPDLGGRVLPILPAFQGGYPQLDGTASHHGTWVASAIGMQINNGIGGAGIGNFSILPITVTDTTGTTNSTAIGQGIRAAADAGAKVIVIAQLSPAYEEINAAAGYALSQNALTFIASGNLNQGKIISSYDNLIFVGGTDQNDLRWQAGLRGSTYGNFVSLSAPATDILVEDGFSSTGADQYGVTTGTSLSVALAGGSAAMAWSINPDLTADQVRGILFSTAYDLGPSGWDQEYGYGRIDVAAVAASASGTLAPEPGTLGVMGFGMLLLLKRRRHH